MRTASNAPNCPAAWSCSANQSPAQSKCRSCRRLRSSDLDPAFCGSWLASDDGLTATQSPTAYTQSNCRSCRRLRSFDLAFAFCGSEPARECGCPTDQYLPVALDPCGSWLASDDGLTANQPKAVCPQFNCGSEPARESGLPSDQYLPVALDPCGSWLASDDGLTANQPATDRPQPNCGSEPARESGLPATTILTDPPQSRAGSLLQKTAVTPAIATTQSPADTAQPPAPSADSN